MRIVILGAGNVGGGLGATASRIDQLGRSRRSRAERPCHAHLARIYDRDPSVEVDSVTARTTGKRVRQAASAPNTETRSIEFPGGVVEAAATLDRISRLCEYGCDHVEACPGETCRAWQLEQAAATYLAARWVAAEG